jgi:hypothetical protein
MPSMKTTIDIADDVLRAAEELARRQRKSAGEVISEILRRAFGQAVANPPADYAEAVSALPSLPRRDAKSVTAKLVDELRDSEA